MTNSRTINTQNLAKMLVGFDNMFSAMEDRYSNQLQTNYPPHNIIKTGDEQYAIQLAVAGFKKSEIAVVVEKNLLTISGTKTNQPSDAEYLHRGLSFRDFERTFSLAEYIVVKDAGISDGILTVSFEKVIPEEKKPRLIEITDL